MIPNDFPPCEEGFFLFSQVLEGGEPIYTMRFEKKSFLF